MDSVFLRHRDMPPESVPKRDFVNLMKWFFTEWSLLIQRDFQFGGVQDRVYRYEGTGLSRRHESGRFLYPKGERTVI